MPAWKMLVIPSGLNFSHHLFPYEANAKVLSLMEVGSFVLLSTFMKDFLRRALEAENSQAAPTTPFSALLCTI